MSKGVTRLGDLNTGHDLCAPTVLITSSSDVLINSKGAGRISDKYAAHGCIDHDTHQDIISQGSTTVFINGRGAARIGDSVSIGGSIAEGSSNVFIGG